MIKPIPDGYHSVQPALSFKDARAAIAFYKKAFGAEEKSLMPGADGKSVMHAEIRIGDSVVMMADETVMGGCKSIERLGNSPVNFYVYVEDADALFNRAVAAGASVVMPMMDMFWGDRMGAVKDPFGFQWSVATHKRDLSHEEIEKGAKEFMAQMADAKA